MNLSRNDKCYSIIYNDSMILLGVSGFFTIWLIHTEGESPNLDIRNDDLRKST